MNTILFFGDREHGITHLQVVFRPKSGMKGWSTTDLLDPAIHDPRNIEAGRALDTFPQILRDSILI